MSSSDRLSEVEDNRPYRKYTIFYHKNARSLAIDNYRIANY
jgi:hypothetical protein